MEGVSESITIAELTSRFAALAAMIPMHPIGNRAEYRRAPSALNQLLDAGAADENHELAPLVTMLGMLIEAYENRTAVNDKPSPAAVLKLLMEQHELTQSELPEIGSQGVVSEILRGKRHLNLRQVKALSERFHVPADVFI